MDTPGDDVSQPELLASPAGPVMRACRAHYQFPLKVYAEKLGRSERGLKQWIEVGKKAVPIDLPPLDQKEDIANWWGRNMSQRVPDDILSWSKISVASLSPEIPHVRNTSDPSEEEEGIGAVLERLREAEAATSKALMEELKKGVSADQGRIELLERRWDKACERLRKFEKDASKIMHGSGELIRRSDVEDFLRSAHGNLSSRIRTFFTGVFQRVKALPQDEGQRVWDEEVDRLCLDLNRNVLPS